MRLNYVSLANLHYLTSGLTISVPRCAEVLDSALKGLNAKTRIPDRIVAWNSRPPERRAPLVFPGTGQIFIDLTQSFSPERGMLYLAQVIELKTSTASPGLHINMRSPVLDIPMRVEIPLRAVIKGGRSLEGGYCVYLHVLRTDSQEDFVYYGITRRGWSLRFGEHMEASLAEESRRLFPSKLRQLIEARIAQREGKVPGAPALDGVISTLCAVGLDEDAALDTEEYLVGKYSLASQHPNGINMIPGGREGMRSLHRLSVGSARPLVETSAREAALDNYLKAHPLLGRPNMAVANRWNDPDYAEAVICGRENRLTADQVREIRYLAATGHGVAEIQQRVGALDHGQVARVLSGRTYARIR